LEEFCILTPLVAREDIIGAMITPPNNRMMLIFVA
jgi:hypothetical protein